MNFIKSILGYKDEQSPMPGYIKDFKIYGSLFKRESKVSKLLLEDALISFSESNSKFNFFLDINKDEEKYFFPIATTMDLREQTVDEGDKVVRKYVFDLEEKLCMRLEFDVTEAQDMKHVMWFEQYFSQLLCITSQKKKEFKLCAGRSTCILSQHMNLIIFYFNRHVQGKDTEKVSKALSQSDSDVFSVVPKTDKSSFGSDISRLTKELSDLNINSNARQGNFKHQIKLFQNNKKQKEQQKKKEEDEEDWLREDILIENRNNTNLQDAALDIVQFQEIKLAQVGSFYKAEKDELVLKHTGIIFAIKILEDFDYKMLIYNEFKHVIHQYHFENGQAYEINHNENYIRWIESKGEEYSLYQVTFDVDNASNEVNYVLSKCNFEKKNQMNQDQAFKEEEIQEIFNYCSHPLKHNYEEENQDYMDEESDITFDPSAYIAQGEVDSDSNMRTMAQAKVLDRTFLTKGENIEVYRTLQDEEFNLQYLLTLPVVQELNGEYFEPKKILMQEQDTKMLLLNNEENKKVFYYDLEKGKIVQEFGVDQDYFNGIKDVCNQSKNGDLDNNKTFYAINKKNIFLMDPRIAKGKAQSSIATEEKFCISSTQNGEFAIGSADGSVRLFNEVTKKAKNKFNLGFGDPILGLDISKDGKWILATCQTYLILFPTYDQKSNQKNGFTSTIKLTDRSAPIKLQLSSEDQYYLKLKEIGFTAAKFDNCINKKEKFIVTSTGVFTIVWDFLKVLQKKTQSYEIKKSDDPIKYADFKFNMNENVLAASTSKLEMQNIIKRKS